MRNQSSRPSDRNRVVVKRRILVMLLAMGITLAVLPGPALAATQSGETVVVPEGETVDEDLRVFGETIIVRGTVNGDLQAFAGEVIVAGTVTGDVDAFAGNVRIDGQVEGDVRTMAGNVQLGPNAMIAGGFEAAGGNIAIDGTVQGDAQVDAGQVTLGPDATIRGSLTHSGELTDQGGTVDGAVTQSEDAPVGGADSVSTPSGGVFAVYAVLANLIVGGVLLAIFPTFSREISRSVAKNPLQTGGVGLGALVGIPVGLVLLMIGIVTVPLSLAGIVVYLLVVWLGSIYGRYAIGSWVLSVADIDNRWADLVVGIAIVALLVRIPVVGGVIDLVVLLLGLGTVVLGAYRRYSRTDATPVATPA